MHSRGEMFSRMVLFCFFKAIFVTEEVIYFVCEGAYQLHEYYSILVLLFINALKILKLVISEIL